MPDILFGGGVVLVAIWLDRRRPAPALPDGLRCLRLVDGDGKVLRVAAQPLQATEPGRSE